MLFFSDRNRGTEQNKQKKSAEVSWNSTTADHAYLFPNLPTTILIGPLQKTQSPRRVPRLIVQRIVPRCVSLRRTGA